MNNDIDIADLGYPIPPSLQHLFPPAYGPEAVKGIADLYKCAEARSDTARRRKAREAQNEIRNPSSSEDQNRD